MDRSIAIRTVWLAIGVGILAEVLIDRVGLGLNVGICVAALVAGTWLAGRVRRPPDLVDLWIPIAALGFGFAAAVRADPPLVAVNTLVAVGLGVGSAAVFSGARVTRRSLTWLLACAIWLTGESISAGHRPLVELRPRDAGRVIGGSAPLLRGLGLAAPIVVVFVVLFASADPIFAARVDDVTGLRLDLGELPGRVAFAGAVSWLVAGLLVVAGHGLPVLETEAEIEHDADGAAAQPSPTSPPVRIRLGAVEATVVLVALDLVFAAFVGLQLVYLFGGLDTLAVVGLTYAEYARRGFFELVAVAILVGGLIFAIEAIVGRRTRTYVAAALGLLGLTVVVLASAALRLGLYQQAYGWTELRFYVAVGIGVLGVAIGTALLLVVSGRTRWLAHGFAGLCLVGLAVCTLVGPSAFVADRNVERALDPRLVPADGRSGLDTEYLAGLPDDAVPTIAAAMPRLDARTAATLRVGLVERARLLAGDPGLSDWRSWNLARERAREALASLGIGTADDSGGTGEAAAR